MENSEEFQLSSPLLPATPPPSLTTAKKSHVWMRWVIGLVIAAGLGGGSYFAHSQGYVNIPFLPSAGAALDTTIEQLNKLTATTSTTTASMYFEDVPGQQSNTNISNGNENINSANTNVDIGSGLSLGTSDLAETLTNKLGSARMTVTGSSYAEPGKTYSLGNAESTITATVQFDGKEYTGVMNYRKVGLKNFVQLDKVEGFDYGGLKSILGQWIDVEPKDAEGLIANEAPSTEELSQLQGQLANLAEIARTNKAYTLKKLGSDTISGHQTTRFQITLEPEKFEETLTEFIAAEKKEGHDVQQFEELLKSWKLIRSEPATRDMYQEMSLELWVGRQDKLPWKISAKFAMAVPEGMFSVSGKRMVYEISNTLTSINQTKTVTAPEKTIKLEDAFGTLISGTAELETAQTKTGDSKRKADVAMIKVALSLYFDDVNTYPDTLNVLAPLYIEKIPTDQNIELKYDYSTCDNNKHFLLVATLETGGKYYLSDQNSGQQSAEAIACGKDSENNSPATDSSSNPTADDDGDGLSNEREAVYGTNPNVPDTDGDGYNDGSEVTNGYNPNGPGKLNISL